MCFNLALTKNYFHVPPWQYHILRMTHYLEGTLTTLSLYTDFFFVGMKQSNMFLP